MSVNNSVRQMKTQFPKCPICNGTKGYTSQYGFHYIVECIDCHTKFKSYNLRNSESPIKSISIINLPEIEINKTIIEKLKPIKNIEFEIGFLHQLQANLQSIDQLVTKYRVKDNEMETDVISTNESYWCPYCKKYVKHDPIMNNIIEPNEPSFNPLGYLAVGSPYTALHLTEKELYKLNSKKFEERKREKTRRMYLRGKIRCPICGGTDLLKQNPDEGKLVDRYKEYIKEKERE